MNRARVFMLAGLGAVVALAVWIGMFVAGAGEPGGGYAEKPGLPGLETPLMPGFGEGEAARLAPEPARLEAALGAHDGAQQPAGSESTGPRRTLRGRARMADGSRIPAGLVLVAQHAPPRPLVIDGLGGLGRSLDEEIDFDAVDFDALFDSWEEGNVGAAPGGVPLVLHPDGTLHGEGLPSAALWVACDDDLIAVQPTCRIPAGNADADVDVVLARGGLLRLSVFGSDGRPWTGGGAVSLEGRFDPWALVSGDHVTVSHGSETLEASGRHAFRRVPAGFPLVVSVEPKGAGAAPLTMAIEAFAPGEERHVVATLSAGIRLAVRVQRQDRTPVAQASLSIERVDLNFAEISLGSGRRSARARTDAEGFAAFEGLAPGRWRVKLDDGAFLPAVSAALALGEGEAPAEVLLVAETGRLLTGRVEDPDGAALEMAFVRARKVFNPLALAGFGDPAEFESFSGRRAWTDAEGRFGIAGLPDGRLIVRAESRGFRPEQRELGTDEHEVVFRLERRVSLSGIVISAATDEPLTDFDVSPELAGFSIMGALMRGEEPDSDSIEPRQFRGREQGTFEFDEMIPGTFDLRFQAPGHGETTVRGVEIGPDGRRGLVVVMQTEATILGQLVDGRDGRPVAGARIGRHAGSSLDARIGELVRTEGGAGSGRVRSDDDGHFRIGGLASLQSVRLVVQHPGFRELPLEPVVLAPGELRDLGRIALSRGAVVEGHVLDPEGRPVGGVAVMCSDPSGANLRRASSDAAGFYRIEGLTAGTWTVMRLDLSVDLGSSAGMIELLSSMSMEAVSLSEDQVATVNLRARTKDGVRLVGTVRDAAGPVGNAVVMALPDGDGMLRMRLGSSDASGRYEVTGLQPGPHEVHVSTGIDPTGGTSGAPISAWSAPIRIGSGPEEHLDVTLPGGVLPGRVVSARDGSPLGSVRVLLRRQDGGDTPATRTAAMTGQRVGEAWTDEQGAFRFERLPGGLYELSAGEPNVAGIGTSAHAVTRQRDIRVLDGTPGFTVVLRLEPGARAYGTVRDPAGRPLAGVAVWVLDADGSPRNPFSETTSGVDGSYEAVGLSGGPFGLAFRGNDHALRLLTGLSVAPGDEVAADVTLEPGVRLLLATGEVPPWAVQVALTGPAGPVPTGLASVADLVALPAGIAPAAGGHVRDLGRLTPGTWTLRATADGAVLHDRTVTLSPGSGPVLVE